MKNKPLLLLLLASLAIQVACSDNEAGVGVSYDYNNDAPNNGTNNGATNNGATNNGATNNGATNNGTNNATNNGTNNPTNNGGLGTAGVGDACDDATRCRPGLECGAGMTCELAGTLAVGQPCNISGECQNGLYCAPLGVCQPAGMGEAGTVCGATGDCLGGLVCVPEGLVGLCGEGGTGDVGDGCTSYLDCYAGLGCGEPRGGGDRQCLNGPSGGFPVPWTGVTCDGPNLDPPFRMYFEANEDEPRADFYRKPFPSDLYLKADGHPDLSEHPTPGVGILGTDYVRDMLDVVQADQIRWGQNQAITMRFSGRINYDTILPNGDAPTLYMIDITPGSSEYNERQPIYWRASSGSGQYICNNWVAVRPSWGRSLNPNTTYAVVATSAIMGRSNADSDPPVAISRDTDFDLVMGGANPGGGLSKAWQAYQPLRDWVGAQSVDAASIVGAVVFTTGDPRAMAQTLRGSVRAAAAPSLASDLVRCDTNVASPCDAGQSEANQLHACGAASSLYDEIQGLVSLPVFQRGDAPYLHTGGELVINGPQAAVQRADNVCFAMTVPKAAAPADGYPVILYAHGTGGTARSHITTLADQITEINVDGTMVPFVMIGWDQVQHGTRRGDSTTNPELLVYNILNPRGSRGTFLQGAADVHAMVRFVEELNIAAANSPTGQAIPLDTSRIYFIGHSQGGTTGPIALPFEPSIKGTVLSGAGAGFVHALSGKTSPVNIPAAVALVLQETPDNVSDTQPIMNILQGYYDPVDPVNFAEYIGARQLDGVTTPRHVFHTFGVGDTYTPKLSLETMATALRLTLYGGYLEEWQRGFVSTSETAVHDNVFVAGQRTTVAGRMYQPNGYDGHFVLFQNPTAQADLKQFLGTMVVNGSPTLGQ